MTAPPVQRIFTQLPMMSWADWQGVEEVKAAIRALEQGQLDRAAQVVESMGRDDRVSGVTLTRSEALPSLPMSVTPVDLGAGKSPDSGRASKASSVSDEAEEAFTHFFPDYVLAELIRWGFMLGVGIAEVQWTFNEERWTPRLKCWHPRNLAWRFDTSSYWVQTATGQVEVVPGNGTWVLFTPYGLEYGWMRGKVRALYVPWLIRQWALRDWARYSEVHGMPIRLARIPSNAEKSEGRRYLRDLANIGTETVVSAPIQEGSINPELDRFDLELVEAMGRSTECFDKLIDKVDACIAIAVLGQNLTTEVKGGSYAATMGHLQIRGDVLNSDGERLAQCLRDQVLKLWALFNFGDPELAPVVRWITKPPDDKKAKAETIKLLGEGIKALQLTGAQPDVDKLLEDNEIPITGPAEDPPAPEPAPMPGQTAKAAKTAKLSKGEDNTPTPAIEGQMYVDDLVEHGVEAMGKLTQTEVDRVLAILDAAEKAPQPYEALRKALEERYPDMPEAGIADLMHRGLIMAELAARHAVDEEIAD